MITPNNVSTGGRVSPSKTLTTDIKMSDPPMEQMIQSSKSPKRCRVVGKVEPALMIITVFMDGFKGSYSVPTEASTRAFSLFPDRNVTTRLADIGVSSPVFGFLPGRLVLSRSSNLPKSEIFTGLLCSKESLIS